MSIFDKLLAVQCELKAPKSQYNSFGKYSYRNCEDILEAVKPLCEKHKAVVFLSDEIEMIGNRFYVKATATFVDVESLDTPPIVVTAYAREEESKKGMDGSQVTGASSSYARKYALNGLFDIDDTKDSDTTNTGDNQPTQSQTKKQPTTPPKAQKGDNALSEVTKAAINASLLTYKKATGIEVKKTLEIIQSSLGFSVDNIKTEEQGLKVKALIEKMLRDVKEGDCL